MRFVLLSRSMRAVLAAALPAVANTGCSTAQPLHIHDSGALLPYGRVRVPLGERSKGWFVEGAHSSIDGEDLQLLSSGSRLEVGGETFDGPARVALEAELRVGEVTLGREMAKAGSRVSVFCGLQSLDVSLQARTAAQESSDRRSSRSLVFGADVAVALKAWLSFDARLDTSFSISGDEMGAAHFDIGLGATPLEHLRLFAGWSHRSVYQVIDGRSDLDLEFSGPALGVAVEL
jgi:hypothetical protein